MRHHARPNAGTARRARRLVRGCSLHNSEQPIDPGVAVRGLLLVARSLMLRIMDHTSRRELADEMPVVSAEAISQGAREAKEGDVHERLGGRLPQDRV